MTVLSSESGSVLGVFLPKPRAAVAAPVRQRAAQRSFGSWLKGHGRQVKDGLVAVAAFGSGTVAAFQWHPWAGFVSIGLSILLVDHSVDRKPRGDT